MYMGGAHQTWCGYPGGLSRKCYTQCALNTTGREELQEQVGTGRGLIMEGQL
jgi:hypothetical protein